MTSASTDTSDRTRTESDPDDRRRPTPPTTGPCAATPPGSAAAAAALRAGDAEQIFGTRFPGEYVMAGVARLLDAVANKIHGRVDLGHDVVSAATEVAEHALAYVSSWTGRRSGDAARHEPSP